MQIYLNLGAACNENCCFCVIKGNEFNFPKMTLGEAKKAVDDFIKKGGNDIILTGGEPTLWEDLPQLLKYMVSRKEIKSINLITNGVIISDKEYFDKLISFDKEKKITFCVSVHSHREKVSEKITEAKGTFNKTIAGLRNIVGAKRKCSIYQVITADNYKDLLAFAKFFKKNFPEIDDITLAYPFPQGNVLLNSWIYVQLDALRPYVVEALKFLNKNEYKISISTCGQFPLCIVPGFEGKVIDPLAFCDANVLGTVGKKVFHAVEWSSQKWINEYKDKGPICKDCLLSFYCQGVWKEYQEVFGFKGLKAINESNFIGNKIKSSLLTMKDLEAIKRKVVKNELNLIIVKNIKEDLLKEMVDWLKQEKILNVVKLNK